MPQNSRGPTLPKVLQDQISAPVHHNKSARLRNGAPTTRKDRRKAEREAKKRRTQQPQKTSRTLGLARNATQEDSGEDDVGWSGNDSEEKSTSLTLPSKPIVTKATKGNLAKSTDVVEKPGSSLAASKVSRTVRERLAQDDAEIAALEKKLGIKRKKRSEATDGLDGILENIGESDSDAVSSTPKVPKRKRDQDDEWLANKRRKALGESSAQPQNDDSDIDEDDMQSSSLEDTDVDGSDQEEEDHQENVWANNEVSSDIDNGSSFRRTTSGVGEPEKSRVRENPYVAPSTSGVASTKYIPPALRAAPSSDAEALARLRRQVQGLLNRITDANMLTILRGVEQIYQNNARGYVTTILIDLLIGLLADGSVLIDTFLILHAGFIAAIYKVIGPDFGAQMIERIVVEFDKFYQENKAGSGKQSTNLISVVAELYSFHVIGSNIVFDYIKFFLDELCEINTELLLRIVRVSGSQLRQDDPASLKDIVLHLQRSVAKVGQSNLPVRTKFMIESINDLKNNKMKVGSIGSVIASEHTNRMRKQLGTLNSRTLKGAEPLRVGLADIKDTEKKGKWWLVGASWRNDITNDRPAQKSGETEENHSDNPAGVEDREIDLFQLAREQHMNTDIRRAIFISIMSASDSKEAHVRLLKLNLKKSQEMEIPRVIVHCAGCEESYNPYYTLLARRFCADHKSRKCFQFALWDIFKSLGEKRDDDDDVSDIEEDDSQGDISLRRLVSLGKLYGTLIAKDGLSITSLKPLNFPYLKAKTKTLIEVMLVTVILESQKPVNGSRDEKALLNIFINTDTANEMVAGLQYFLKKSISKTGITTSKKEKATVKWGCKIVMDMLERLRVTTVIDED